MRFGFLILVAGLLVGCGGDANVAADSDDGLMEVLEIQDAIKEAPVHQRAILATILDGCKATHGIYHPEVPKCYQNYMSLDLVEENAWQKEDHTSRMGDDARFSISTYSEPLSDNTPMVFIIRCRPKGNWNLNFELQGDLLPKHYFRFRVDGNKPFEFGNDYLNEKNVDEFLERFYDSEQMLVQVGTDGDVLEFNISGLREAVDYLKEKCPR